MNKVFVREDQRVGAILEKSLYAFEVGKRKAAVAEKLSKGRLDYVPDHQTPWQEIQRGIVDQFEEGMVLKPAVKYRDVAKIVPRDNH